jgi:coenzyme F420 hydrogenase subunit beta
VIPRTIAAVVRSGLCTGCGLCEALGRGEGVRMTMNAEGYLRPSTAQAPSAGLQRRILEVCPGILQRPMREAGTDRLWGPYHDLFTGHAEDPELRFRGSSGGVLTAAALHLLESGAVDAVLHVRADPRAPLRTVAQLSRNRADLLSGIGSRYAPGAPLVEVEALLAAGESFAVIGKPCDIAGIRNLARRDARVAPLLRFTMSFLCAGVSSQRISERIVNGYGLAEGDVRILRYRGHGCPGALHIQANDGRIFEQSYDETWSSALNQAVQFRCKICPDSTGEQADLVCGDAWASADGYAHGNHDGEGAVIARSERGAALLREMRDQGVVALRPLAQAALTRMQLHHPARKRAVLPRLMGMAVAGAVLPDFRGMRLWRCAIMDLRGAWRNFRGTARRVRAGRNRETYGVP